MTDTMGSPETLDPKDALRLELEREFPGDVYDTAQLQEKFEVIGFGAPFVVVIRKSDSRKGSLQFNHNPRLYFKFVADK